MRALQNRRFRSLLLAIAGIPIALLYIWRTVVLPALIGAPPGDFADNYIGAAAKVAAGRDPYDLCLIVGCPNQPPDFRLMPLAGPQYVTPPPVAWMLQPLVGMDSHVQLALVVAVLQLSLAVFIACALRALGVTDWQTAALLVLVTIGFEPVIGNLDEGQINLVLLGLSGIWLLAWVAGDRWWGGAALGLGVAIKLLQGPTALVLLWGRRWRMAAAAGVAGLGLWLLAVPQYLPEYFFKVAPALSAGTGLFENHSPGGTVTRLLDPSTFLGASNAVPAAARVITLLIGIVALLITFWMLGRPRGDRIGRALEAGAVVAVVPLVASYSWGTHLVLLLLPIYVLVVWALDSRDWLVIGLVVASYLLIGPAHKLLQVLLVGGYTDLLVLRVLAELGVVGILCLWSASLLAVRRSAHGLDAADQDGAQEKKQDGAGKDDAIAAVPMRTVQPVD